MSSKPSASSDAVVPVGINAGINVSILRGRLLRDPEERTLASGTRLLSLAVTIPIADGPDESVPVGWFDPPGRATRFRAGHEVLVIGRTRKRFYRANGATVSRTEVVAEVVLASGRSRGAQRRVEEVAANLIDAFARC
ncbi:MAG: hypothetical protein ABI276_06510 [Acidimicrobiales bacterium]